MNNIFCQNANDYLQEIKSKKLQKVVMPRITLLYGGGAFFKTLFDVIDNAQDWLWISNYTIEDDKVTQIYFEKLSNAQRRGVKVFFFYDFLVSTPCLNSIEHIRSLGGKIYERNSRGLFEGYFMRSYFQRDHQKLVMADNKILMGSSNFSEEYGGGKYGKKFFKDINVLVENVQLKKVYAFFQVLISQVKKTSSTKIVNEHFKIDQTKLIESPFSYKFNFAFNFHPIQVEIQPGLISKINNAKKSIKIIQAYYIPVQEFDDAIFRAHKRGVKVQFITAKQRDVPCYKYFYNYFLFKEYLKRNIEVYEYNKRFLHAKAFCIDDDYISIGSFNTDQYSWTGNNEIMMEIYDQIDQAKKFDKIWNNCQKQSQRVYLQNLSFQQMITQQFWMFFQFGVDRLMVRSHFFRQSLETKFRDNVHNNRKLRGQINYLYKTVNSYFLYTQFFWQTTKIKFFLLNQQICIKKIVLIIKKIWMNKDTKFSDIYQNLLNPLYHNTMPTYNEDDFPQVTEDFKILKLKFLISNYRRKSQLSTYIFINQEKYEDEINQTVDQQVVKDMNTSISAIFDVQSLDETFTSVQDQFKSLDFLNDGFSNCSKQFKQNDIQFERNWRLYKNKNPVLIYLHSHGGHLFEGTTLIEPFLKQNIDVVLFDFSGFGQSTGDKITFGLEEQYDLETVIQYLKKHLNYTQFGIYGRSMGALAALFYAQHSFDIQFLVLDSLIQSFKENALKFVTNHYDNFFKNIIAKIGVNIVKNKIKQQYNIDLEQINIEIPAQQISCPVLLIYGQNDQIIDQQNRQNIFGLFNTIKYIVQVPNKDHFDSKLTKDVIEEVVSFSNKNFHIKNVTGSLTYLRKYNKQAKKQNKKLCNSLLDIDVGLLLKHNN